MRHVHRHRHLFHRLIPIVLASFLCFLTQPQIATLHHDHHDGEHFHTHTDLFVSFLAALTHSHRDDHNHDHAHGRAHTHAPVRQPPVSHTTPAYSYPDSFERGHWHTFTALHQPWLVTALQQLPQRLVQFFSFQQRQVLYVSFSVQVQPRAPPVTF